MEPLRKEKKHLLIVGGTGFIGHHLAEYIINKGWKSFQRIKKK
jgi:NAD dependent epimerase/dehydratase family.